MGKRIGWMLACSAVLVMAVAGPALAEGGRANSGFVPPTGKQRAAAAQKEQRVDALVARLRQNPTYEPGLPNQRVLSTANYIAQPDQNTCGPTSVHNLLLNWNQNVSLDTLKTELGYQGADGTPFTQKIPDTINTHISIPGEYHLRANPTEDEVWGPFLGDVSSGYPLIVNVHMAAYGDHLPGYRQSTEYWHYVTGNGYKGAYAAKDQRYVYYFDPYNRDDATVGNPYGEHVVTLTQLAGLAKDRGLVW